MYIDGDNLILGRLANQVSQMLLAGESIVIVNADKIVISGNRDDIYKRFKHRTDLADRANPRRGPFFPKTPDRLVRRTIRGMLPWGKPSGREAFRRLKVFVGVPPQYADAELVRLEDADGNNLGTHKIVTVAELSNYLRGE
jgi:large subunit ribosomal protein L13